MTNNLIPDFDKKTKSTKIQTQLQILQNIRNCKLITDFLELRTRGDTTRSYAGSIRDYFIELNITKPDNYLKDPRRMLNRKKIDYLDNIEKDVLKFNKSLQNKSGSYRLTNLSAIRKLLETNKIELGNAFWQDTRKNGKKAHTQTDTKTPSPEQLKNILHGADPEGKAFFLVQMTSLSRIDEIRLLTFDMLDLEHDPPSFRLPAESTKNGKPITKFITPEAKQWLQRYLKERDNILETRINRSNYIKSKETDFRQKYKNRVFPMSEANIETKWKNLMIHEGLHVLDDSSNKPKMGTHSLRRYGEDNLGNAKLSKCLQGKTPNSESSYQYKTENKLEEEYKKYMHNLYVFETTEETKKQLAEHQKTIDEQTQKIKDLNKKIKLTDIGRKSSENKVNKLKDKLEITMKTVDLLCDKEEFEETLKENALSQKVKKLIELIKQNKENEPDETKLEKAIKKLNLNL